jgi:sulfhydrogenase subunit beta (sulfur reductase)
MNTKLEKEFYIESSEISTLILLLKDFGYKTIAPKVYEKTIIYDEIDSVKDLPIGYTDIQDKGTYSITKTDLDTFFHYNVGAYSWKKFLFPPIETIFKATKKGNSFDVCKKENNYESLAFIGVRACEINAINIQDKIFIQGEYINLDYKNRREKIFIVAINCSKAGNNCFCLSTDSGPEVKSDYDLSLTEVINQTEHFFIIKAGSKNGIDILEKLQTYNPSSEQINNSVEVINKTKNQMEKLFDLSNVKSKLDNNFESPHWDEISKKCLSCTNCTMVCPTCFCFSVEDVTDLKGENAERVRKWSSCFTLEHSYIHGGSIRKKTSSKYRQWLTHKFSTWFDQFGSSGCVGCGRCITWCPVGIDITEEVKLITNNGVTD